MRTKTTKTSETSLLSELKAIPPKPPKWTRSLNASQLADIRAAVEAYYNGEFTSGVTIQAIYSLITRKYGIRISQPTFTAYVQQVRSQLTKGTEK